MPRIDEIAFDSERKRMTTLHETLDGRISFTKGSPDEILERCRYVWSNGKTAAFSAAAREQAKRGLDVYKRQVSELSGEADER